LTEIKAARVDFGQERDAAFSFVTSSFAAGPPLVVNRRISLDPQSLDGLDPRSGAGGPETGQRHDHRE
jgi:hypothetical protein